MVVAVSRLLWLEQVVAASHLLWLEQVQVKQVAGLGLDQASYLKYILLCQPACSEAALRNSDAVVRISENRLKRDGLVFKYLCTRLNEPF